EIPKAWQSLRGVLQKEKTKATPHNSGARLACILFRQSAKKSDCAIRAPELCGIALSLLLCPDF
ncbi:MAG: hypothetical protein IIZ07_03915, partial [Ruminococcus sp.]|nr:hypothetical protein [Ruminococcus sp.]